MVGQKVFVHLNDEAGCVWYSVEPQNDVGNWLNSFDTLVEAEEYIRKEGLIFDQNTDFYDTRSAHNRLSVGYEVIEGQDGYPPQIIERLPFESEKMIPPNFGMKK